jgi:hypothetical protein
VRIGQTLVLIGNVPTLKPRPKSDASAGDIAIDAETISILQAHRARQNEERLAAGELWTDSGLVFTDELGRPLHPETVLRRFQRLAVQAGLRPCRLHSLRHAYASALLDAGVPLEAISKRLRHAGISVTNDLYLHLTGKLDREIADAGAAYILGGGTIWTTLAQDFGVWHRRYVRCLTCRQGDPDNVFVTRTNRAMELDKLPVTILADSDSRNPQIDLRTIGEHKFGLIGYPPDVT